MIVLDGLLFCVYDGYLLSLVYGSYEQVAILGAREGRFLTAVGYYG